MDHTDATNRIKTIFSTFRTITDSETRSLLSLSKGKLYELFVLSEVIVDLRRRGFSLNFSGNSIKFQSSPGSVNQFDPHFDVYVPGKQRPSFQIFVDVNTLTLGSTRASKSDLSHYHELDIAVISAGVTGLPKHHEVAMAVECKAVATLTKGMVRGVIGLRRELSLLVKNNPSILSAALPRGQQILVPATPPSELWLVFIDDRGVNYSSSPEVFGIELRHREP